MNRRKKIVYASVLIGGALLLLADRLFFGPGPHSAEAAAGVRSLSALGVTTPTGPARSLVAAAFPKGLPPRSPATMSRDVFQLTDRARDLLAGLADDDGAGERVLAGRSGGNTVTPAIFQRDHKLAGVMRQGDEWVALVDDTWLGLGHKIDGCTLEAITGADATFVCPGGRAVLSAIPSRPSR
ncbi:MAG: hypothetical protein HOP29_02505 [Phycisphaerales bacterium]|nr:hypothetical protein [Phycisphaerales bacterium]